MRQDSGYPRSSTRRPRRGWTVALLLTFIAVQPWATCPVLCLTQGHAVATSAHHHHHDPPCHDGSQLRNERPSFAATGDMIAAAWTPSAAPLIRGIIPIGPATFGRPQPDLSADPPPPRRA
ncbi:MAG TPA: hypothetical protein VLD58_10295 [Gemmatimonadales bacterium]|nr:hypothetical protein [Gemmatimonadales bacterium]